MATLGSPWAKSGTLGLSAGWLGLCLVLALGGGDGDGDIDEPPIVGEGQTNVALPELPPIQNVRVRTTGDNVVIEFEPVDDARDYRIYVSPDMANVTVGGDGAVTVRDANNYERKPEDAVLGYVFLTAADDRSPVYRMSAPNGGGGHQNADWVVSIFDEANRAEYVVGEAERDRLYALGFRNDGIAFYVANDSDRAVYRRHQ